MLLGSLLRNIAGSESKPPHVSSTNDTSGTASTIHMTCAATSLQSRSMPWPVHRRDAHHRAGTHRNYGAMPDTSFEPKRAC